MLIILLKASILLVHTRKLDNTKYRIKMESELESEQGIYEY